MNLLLRLGLVRGQCPLYKTIVITTQNNFGSLIDRIIRLGIEKSIISLSDILCMSNNEIEYIENMFFLKLPVVYKQFLSVCSNGFGQLIDNSLLDYPPSLLHLHEDVREMMEEDIETMYYPIPDNAFFFASTLGTHYWYFICDSNSDPIVYYITAGEKKHLKCYELSTCIVKTLSDSIKI
jgi:SMI1-KNR4 cell-wall